MSEILAGNSPEFIPATRNEALRHVARLLAPEAGAAASPALKSLYDELMPRATRMRPRPITAVAERAAEIAGIDIHVVAAANGVPLHQGLDPVAAQVVGRAGGALMPAVRAVLAASPIVRPEVYAAQDRLAGRTCSSAERDNFRTRAHSRLLDEAADALRADPRLLSDETVLRDEILDAVRAGLADEQSDRWSKSWSDARRRANGDAGELASTGIRSPREWDELVRGIRPKMLGYARRLSPRDPHLAEDVVQEALIKLLRTSSGAATFRAHALTQVKQTYVNLITKRHAGCGGVISVDWADRSGDGTGHSAEERTLGSAERAWSALSESHDGQIDALRVLSGGAPANDPSSPDDPLHDAVRTELRAIVARLRAGDARADALTDRPALIAHLTRSAQAAGARSVSHARSVVLDVLAGFGRSGGVE